MAIKDQYPQRPPLAALPQAPKEYSQSYMNELIRLLNFFMRRYVNDTVYIHASELNLSNLEKTAPGDSTTLRSGDVYIWGDDQRTLKILLPGDAPVSGQSLTGSVGTVTVLTP